MDPLEPIESTADENRAPHLLASVWTLTALSLVFLALRYFCKFRRHNGFWWDDYILLVSWICLLLVASLTTAATGFGLGRHFTDVFANNPTDLFQIARLIGLTSLMSILAAVWSKTSFAVTLLRFVDGWKRPFLWFAIASMNALMLTAAILLFTSCAPVQKTWDPTIPGSCLSLKVDIVIGVVASAYSGVMDVLLALMAWRVVWGLSMETREKAGVALAMSMGVFAAAIAFIKCYYIGNMAFEDPTYTSVTLMIWGAAESAVTIIAASIPILRTMFLEVSMLKYRSRSVRLEDGIRMSTSRMRNLSFSRAPDPPQGSAAAVNAGVDDDASIVPSRGGEESSLGSDVKLGGILRTTEVEMNYHRRESADRYGYEP
ncbi:hypothetical protein QBC33DRAFT_529996 [Phialemonium atrogriseum]|uniref:Rhodopsin domain-containing protein n=1 Tax=Phialemonium atrogriseum TaxID=1093897 RepID=A0AAJ0C4Z7_9PEZI|nr:uncharacterized protein QBC33DRAFT_529996 [Phialemonium atrogriseum]KAK1770050.1 hypothetical protein QBC33DRAFT_529996 [Phialemonium atrogriseum]